MRLGPQHLRRPFLERGHVHDPDPPAVRGDHQFAVARVHHQVMYRHGRQAAVLVPGLAAVEREEQAKLGADVEQILVARVLADDVHRAAGRQVARDVLPLDAVVGGLEDVGPMVVVAVAVDGEVRGPLG